MNALILVDIQNDFLPGGALAVTDGNAVVEVANRAMDHFPLIVATRDWHPPGHQSFAGTHQGKSVGEVIDLDGLQQILWPDHCVQETLGADFAPGLRTENIQYTILKGTNPRIDSYSGFFDNGHRQSTGLETLLKQKHVSHCYLLGLATDYCIKFTALDAVKCRFETTVIVDGCRAVNLKRQDEQAAIDEMRSNGVAVIKSGAISSSSNARHS